MRTGSLPQISWVVAPEAFTEHPNWPANYGAWYVSQVLDALTSDPDVWSKTALFITYDENDGFFDHVVPPHPAVGTLPGDSTVPLVDELYTGPEGVVGNYGLGQRVPMLVISPWSTGGWVCSETFDHTSMIRFMEARFGVHEPNITPWRRAVCGDLTSAFDFGRSGTSVPVLPSTRGYRPPDDRRHPDYVPVPPKDPTLPVQESGVRPSRPLGYRLDVLPTVGADGVRIAMRNHGHLGAVLQARTLAPHAAPASYTIGAGHHSTASWATTGGYDIALHGPDGYYRHLVGQTVDRDVEVTLRDAGRRHAELQLVNSGASAARVRVVDAYTGHVEHVDVPAGRTRVLAVDTGDTGGWYDRRVTLAGDANFLRELAGRVDTGRPGTSDPQLGG